MSSEEKIDAYWFYIKSAERDSFPEQVLVIEDNIIAYGTWATGTQDRIEGILKGLELANYPSNIIKNTIIDHELKTNFDAQKLMKYVRT
jgi:hypothetical protein